MVKKIKTSIALSMLLGTSLFAENNQIFQTVHDNSYAAQKTGQSFTATDTGKLTSISIKFHENTLVTSGSIGIYEGVGPGKTLLHTENVTVPSDGGWKDFEISSDISLTSGTEYQFIINDNFAIYASSSDEYDGGQRTYFGFYLGGDDIAFKINALFPVSYLETMQGLTATHLYGVGDTLDNYSGSDSDISTFKTALNNYEGTQQARKLEQAIPTVVANAPQTSIHLTDSMSNMVSSRQTGQMGLNSGDTQFSDKNFWLKPFGSKSIQDDKSGISGFDAESYGMAVGVDAEYESGKRVGIAFFYTNTDVDTNNVSQTNSIDSYSLVGYGSNYSTDIDAKLYYQFGATLNKNDSNRYVELIAKTATASYDSHAFFADFKAIRDHKVDNKLTLHPELGATLSYFKNKSFSESGAGGMNLSTDSFSSNAVVASVGSGLTYTQDKETDFTARAAINYDFANKTNEVSSSYQGGGSSFSTKGLKNSALGYEIGVGMKKDMQNDLSFDINYDLFGKGSDYTNHSVSAKFNWKF